jgi:hypothetical protein
MTPFERPFLVWLATCARMNAHRVYSRGHLRAETVNHCPNVVPVMTHFDILCQVAREGHVTHRGAIA